MLYSITSSAHCVLIWIAFEFFSTYIWWFRNFVSMNIQKLAWYHQHCAHMDTQHTPEFTNLWNKLVKCTNNMAYWDFPYIIIYDAWMDTVPLGMIYVILVNSSSCTALHINKIEDLMAWYFGNITAKLL